MDILLLKYNCAYTLNEALALLDTYSGSTRCPLSNAAINRKQTIQRRENLFGKSTSKTAIFGILSIFFASRTCEIFKHIPGRKNTGTAPNTLNFYSTEWGGESYSTHMALMHVCDICICRNCPAYVCWVQLTSWVTLGSIGVNFAPFRVYAQVQKYGHKVIVIAHDHTVHAVCVMHLISNYRQCAILSDFLSMRWIA